MTKFDVLQHRALELAGHVGDGLRHAIPTQAGKWLQTGAALGAARAAAQTAGKSVRRHPAISGSVVLAVVAGAGLACWLSHRRREQQAGDGNRAIEGRATRVEGRRPRRNAGQRRGARNNGNGASSSRNE